MKIKINDCEECKSFDDEENCCSLGSNDFESCSYDVFYDSDNHTYIYKAKIEKDN